MSKSMLRLPEIYPYHSYRIFLRDCVAHLKNFRAEFSLKEFAHSVQLSDAFLLGAASSGDVPTPQQLMAVAARLGLDQRQSNYLLCLYTIKESEDLSQRRRALLLSKAILHSRFKGSRGIEPLRYFSHLRSVVNRENI